MRIWRIVCGKKTQMKLLVWNVFFLKWYVNKEVSLDSAEEAERLVGWACKVSLMNLQREIFLNIHVLKMEREQESLSLKECSSCSL